MIEKRRLRILAAIVLVSLALSFGRGGRDAFPNAVFRLGFYERAALERKIGETVDRYNEVSATFYNTGGDIAGLNLIPAAKLMKRRLFKDINMLKGDGLLMVFDKDRVVLRTIKIKNRTEAVAETSEVWALALQDRKTREPVFNIKAIDVICRYMLTLENGNWVVEDVDVYPGKNASAERILDSRSGRS